VAATDVNPKQTIVRGRRAGEFDRTSLTASSQLHNISHNHLKVDGQWRIVHMHTTRLSVDEKWLTEPR
jgi:hypothetical protein